MKIKVSKSEILDCLKVVEMGIPKSNSYLVGGLLFEIGDEAKLISNNVEFGVIARLEDVEIEEEGKAFLQNSIIKAIKLLPKEEVLLSTTNNIIKIESGNARFSFSLRDSDDFPRLVGIDNLGDYETIELDASELSNAIILTSFAASKKMSPFDCVLMEIDRDNLKMVASDTYRLTHISAEHEWHGDKTRMIIPKKSVANIAKALSGYEGKVNISFGEKSAVFNFGQYTISCILLEYTYPELESVIPKACLTEVKVNKDEMLNAISRAIVASNEKYTKVMMWVENGSLRFSLREDESSYEDKIESEVKGEDTEQIIVNAMFMHDCLNALKEKDILLGINDAKSPILIKSEIGKWDYNYVVMTIRK